MIGTATNGTTKGNDGVFDFDIEYLRQDAIDAVTIRAAYVRHEDGMIVFKDEGHGVVFMINQHQLVSIIRLDTPGKREVSEAID